MSGSSAAPFMGPEMRKVRRELAGATDQRVLDVLRFVDGLNDRSQADTLLAPLRDRLRALRPPRPLRFGRLLWQPLGPAIVDQGDWRVGQPAVPRSALPILATVVMQTLPEVVAEVERIIADAEVPEADRIEQAGHLLWKPAAEILGDAAPPEAWQATSLPAGTFQIFARAAALVLKEAWALVELSDASVPAEEVNQALTAMLAASEPAGAQSWGILLTVLLQRFPTAEAPIHGATVMRADRAMRDAAACATEAAWSWIEAAAGDLGLGDPAEAAADVRRQVALLEELSRNPANRRRATDLQAALRTASAARFAVGVQQRLLAPLQSLTAAEAADGGVLALLESDARALRRLDIDSRRLGCGAALDARLSEAAAAIVARTDIPFIDRARLVEILRGPQAAAALNG